MGYLQMLQVQMGIPMWLLISIFAWSIVWKLLALWKSARKNHVAWFIIIAIVNTIGILEILYIYVFSDAKKEKKELVKKKSSRRKVGRR